MTGYGRADGWVAGKPILVEIRCLNHRFRDVRLSMPRQWLALEVTMEKVIRSRVARGRVECNVRTLGSSSDAGEPTLDEDRLKKYAELYQRVVDTLKLDEKPSLSLLARSEGVLTYRTLSEDLEETNRELVTLVQKALDASDGMRVAEGIQLQKEIEGLLGSLRELLDEIKSDIPMEMENLQARTRERILSFAELLDVGEDRLVQEMALLAERADVTEELARMDSHIGQFSLLIKKDGPVGREMDFLLQEMNREVNTLCSKFHSALVVRKAVTAKARLEKIREQIQNLE
jgi:uncharacterized protein (TIGR00255 family)